MSKIDELREKTYQDTMRLLGRYGEAVIVRPTSFGKTGLLVRILRDYIEQGKHVLYLYPQDTVRQAVCRFWYGEDGHDEIPGVIFLTYTKLAKYREKDIFSLTDGIIPDLVIADECHRLGGKATMEGFRNLRSVYSSAEYLGATATPERSDLVDITGEFHDHVVSKYTLHDAFSDAVIARPYYCFCTYTEDDVKETEEEAKKEIAECDPEDRQSLESQLTSRLIEISNLRRMDNIIRETCEDYVPNTSYMKFLVFFANFRHLHEKSKDVKKWFQNAYPDHRIRELTVTSENTESREGIHGLNRMRNAENTIDLIYAVDMMTTGYHPGDLTGIMMYRGTASGIVFAQQLGRALSSSDTVPPVVFDVVDNLHRVAMYDVLQTRSKKTIARKKEWKILSKKELLGEVKLTRQEEKRLAELSRTFGKAIGVQESGELLVEKAGWWRTADVLTSKDLVATGHEATYRELIAKTVAEPRSMRCRQAWGRWLEKGGSDEPFTRNHVLEQKAPDAVPLSPYARLKKVSVEAVLQEMGL